MTTKSRVFFFPLPCSRQGGTFYFVPLVECSSSIVLDNACVQPDTIRLFSHSRKIKGVSFLCAGFKSQSLEISIVCCVLFALCE